MKKTALCCLILVVAIFCSAMPLGATTKKKPQPKHCVAFYMNDGTHAILTRKVVIHSRSIGWDNIPRPERNYYDFVGWEDSQGNEFTGNTKVTQDTEVYAQWRKSALYITFFIDSNQVLTKKSVSYGDSIGKENMPKPPEKKGNDFDGWKDSLGNAFTEDTEVTKSINVYVQWKEKDSIPFPNILRWRWLTVVLQFGLKISLVLIFIFAFWRFRYSVLSLPLQVGLLVVAAFTCVLAFLDALPCHLEGLCYALISTAFGTNIIVPFVKNRPGRTIRLDLGPRLPFELTTTGQLKINPFVRGDGTNLIPDTFYRKKGHGTASNPLLGTWINTREPGETIRFTDKEVEVRSPYFNPVKAKYRLSEDTPLIIIDGNIRLFEDEAKTRYESVKDSLPTEYPYVWGPCDWEGGQNFSYMYEEEGITYDPRTMGAEWKGCTRSVRYVYPEGEGETRKLKVRGWRLKK